MNNDGRAYRRSLRNMCKAMVKAWIRFWMRYAGLGFWGRMATRFASWPAPPHKARKMLAEMNRKGYISTSAIIYHSDVEFGANIFIDDRVILFKRTGGGPLQMGDRVSIHRDTILETAIGGSIEIGADSSIHPRCQLNAYMSSIKIGSGVMIAPNCSFYSYNHGLEPGRSIRKQQLKTKGPIEIGNDVWIGVGVTVLSGVRIGNGAVIGAGSIVTHDIPDMAIAMGVPARVSKLRGAKNG